jgi:DNA processing protein
VDDVTEKEALISFSTFVPLGPARVSLLISFFGSASKAWRANAVTLRKIGLREEKITGFLAHREKFDPSSYLKALQENNIKAVVKSDKSYPTNLNEIEGAPLVLYFKGDISRLVSAVAIVGAREMSPYGKEVAQKFARELSNVGITIVSGLARGIDTAAHEAAILANGRTVAVLGCGLDRVYPPENLGLAAKIIKAGGALISEYPLGYPVLKMNFPARNRIISGIAKAVIVVEGSQKSGTLLTASAAAEQGRSVLAVPGQITSPNSAAPLFLLKNGAKIAISSDDVLEELELD